MREEIWIMEPGKGNRILELGAPRDEVLRRLAAAGVEFDNEEDDPDDDEVRWTYIEDMDAELTFGPAPGFVLEEIEISDERLRLGPIEIIEQPLGKTIDVLRVVDEETLWTCIFDDEVPASAAAANGGPAAAAPSAEKLLSEGILWIRPFGLGLGVIYGHVITVYLRRPGDIPHEGVGPLTPEHRALTQRPDLSSHLIAKDRTYTGTTPGKSRFQTLALIALVVALGLIIYRGIEYQARWNNAPAVQASIVAVKPPPPEPFPEECTVVYVDQEGTRHEVVLDRNEVYFVPKIGETIELQYLPEAPHEPLGPAKVRDIAFEKYVPWGIGVVAGYFVLQLAAGIIGIVWRKAQAM